ncbi:hypothetical protein D3C84_1141680 [compost metagenome]
MPGHNRAPLGIEFREQRTPDPVEHAGIVLTPTSTHRLGDRQQGQIEHVGALLQGVGQARAAKDLGAQLGPDQAL